MRVVVTGGREYTDVRFVFATLDCVEQAIKRNIPILDLRNK